MVRFLFLMAVLIVSCFAAPGERVRRYYHDVGLGGYGGGGGGGGFGGYGPGHGGLGYGGHGGGVPVGSQSFSKSSASSSSVATGGGYGKK